MRIYHRNKGIPLKKIKNLSNVQMQTRVKLTQSRNPRKTSRTYQKPLGPAAVRLPFLYEYRANTPNVKLAKI